MAVQMRRQRMQQEAKPTVGVDVILRENGTQRASSSLYVVSKMQ